ncbi:hypothetical protein BDV37DRAFT_260195 [Aspergillus pseudonomiae]|uniref:Uncharacterized protein n=1 Tax=Aspergillus pseudonomiae TaxID=1506151 RepID=A0A5N7CZV7_9EURO|nr:uncharacterized protein BDV37DRAFT_260195 [Aspergillus pseudonomiae]KAE8399529.1 hypothetical protein BDV37DRAFT_260195 [Aspergillus pseudonomiae]
MVINFNFSTWGTACQSRREYCIKTIAVHEFGHFLGFSHGNNRPDTPRNICTEEPQGNHWTFHGDSVGPSLRDELVQTHWSEDNRTC